MKQKFFKSLAMLLLRFKPAAAFDPSFFRLGSCTGANLRKVDLKRRRSVGRCFSPVGQSNQQPLAKDEASGLNEQAVRIEQQAYDAISAFGRSLVQSPQDVDLENLKTISKSIKKIDSVVEKLEIDASSTPQLSRAETVILIGSVAVSIFSPFLASAKVCEVLVPAMGATAAAVGFNAEYIGKSAVSRGKEIAAITVEAAAEAEIYLARAERAKAIIPLCVGISTTAAAFAVIAPELVEELALTDVGQTEIYLLSPVVCILAACVAALAQEETRLLSDLAVGVGARRFSSSKRLEEIRTWLSVTELIMQDMKQGKKKYADLTLNILPAPIIGILFPGTFSSKAIVAGATAAIQAAVSLVFSEYALAQAVDAVAVKTRCSGVSEAYAKQGVCASSILPYTSALAGFCGASTVVIVEFLPYLHSLTLEALGGAVFPAMGALIAATASISKARCEYDAQAATVAATLLAEKNFEVERSGPIEALKEVIVFTISNARKQLKRVLPRNG